MAGLSTTQSFADGDTVTAAKLNNIIANASIDDDAVTTAKINDNAVTLAQMANNSVDTAELVDDAVQNSKLETMAAKTVKANATNATANPTDVAVAANKLLVGTSNSINAVSFTDDLELDASDSAATKIKAAATLIGGKSSVTADSSDELLIKDATDGALKRATAQSVVQSQVATTGTSGVVRVSSASKLIDVSSAITADVVGITTGAPMLAKAWGRFSHAGGGTGSSDFTWTQSFNIDQSSCSADTSTKVMTIAFSTALPSANYIIVGHAWGTFQLAPILVTPGTSNFTIKFFQYNVATVAWPTTEANFVVYGLTS
tara:strand:- start:26 stop:976 length:951 start_codon:yes stop_codon:yes gene_type:complete